MLEKSKAIILGRVRYGDTSLICSSYTRNYGQISFLVRSVFRTTSKSKISHFFPLCPLEIVFSSAKSSSSLCYLRESRSLFLYKTLYTNQKKVAISFFLAEFLNLLLKEGAPNGELFDFIISFLQELDLREEYFEDLHLMFIIKLSLFFGFFPNRTDEFLPFFCLKEGIFKNILSPFSLNQENTLLFKKLLDLDFSKNFLSFNKEQRESLLFILLRYFSFHLGELKQIKSMEMLKIID